MLVDKIKNNNYQKVVVLTEINSFTTSIRKMLVDSSMKERIVEDTEFLPDSVNLTDRYQTFLNSYHTKYGAYPESSFSLSSSYDGLITILTAVKSVGTNSEKIKDFLDKNEIELSQGKHRFDDHGDLLGMHFVIRKMNNGKVEIVK